MSETSFTFPASQGGQRMDRRDFLRQTSGVALGMTMGAAILQTQAADSPAGSVGNSIRIACIGIRGRGANHIDAFQALPGVQVAALCDVDQKVIESGAAALEKKCGHK